MGRELRRIPQNWQHPRDERGEYIPLHDRAYSDALAEYEEGRRLWAEGAHPAQLQWPSETALNTYETWVGEAPDRRYYRTESWAYEETNQWVLYENTSEGTPVSPAFDGIDELLAWMAANGYTPAEVNRIAGGWRLPTITAYLPRQEQEGHNE